MKLTTRPVVKHMPQNLLSQLIANGCETKLATSLSASHWTAKVSTDIPLGEFNQSIQEDQNERSKDSLPPLMKWAVTREDSDGNLFKRFYLSFQTSITILLLETRRDGMQCFPQWLEWPLADSSSLHTVLACSIQSLRFWKISPTLSPD